MSEDRQLGSSRPLLLDLLLAKGGLAEKDVDNVLQVQAKESLSLEEALLSGELVSEEEIVNAYTEYMRLPCLSSLAALTPDKTLATLLPEKLARDYRILPLHREDGRLQLAMADPSNLTLLQEIQLYTGLTISVVVARLSEIAQGLDTLFGSRDLVREIAHEEGESSADPEEEADEEVVELGRQVHGGRDTQVVRLVNHILIEAIRDRASDIHLEPYPEEVKVRVRIDGNLVDITPPPRSLFLPLISRLKILAKMDIGEKRLPQDGAFAIDVGELLGKDLSHLKIDTRVSTVPTVYGEKMVLRILNKEAVPLELPSLGFNERQCQDFFAASNSPHGLLFVTGPTGSGKSTTLYATLNHIKSPTKNILTVEDPVEYKFVGITQVQVKPLIGLNFANVLRAFLRQDPDVIMVGEVRDQETAQICLRAALTGHLVLTSLHTNDALSSIARLEDMGMEPFLIASSLRLLEAQRLVRRLCPSCKEPYQPDPETAESHGLSPTDSLYRPKGCAACRDVGYRGRLGIFEVIKVTPALQNLILEHAPIAKLKEAVRKEGMQLLLDNGLDKVRQGLTSLQEVLAVTLGGGE